MEKIDHAAKAKENFLQGYNCSQSVIKAFEDMYDMDSEQLLMLCSPFGGGMGRLREVCGTVSGMFMVLGILYGYKDPKDFEGKKNYHVQFMLSSTSRSSCVTRWTWIFSTRVTHSVITHCR